MQEELSVGWLPQETVNCKRKAGKEHLEGIERFCDRAIERLETAVCLGFQSPNGSMTQSRNSLRFLQDRNLPGVIKFVLRDTVQHEIEIVFLAGNALAEA